MRFLSQCAGLAILSLSAGPPSLMAQQSGEEIFQQKCVACHTLNADRLVGPGLAGVMTRRDRAWVKWFIMRPDLVLGSEDSIAAGLLEEYVVPMPNFGLTDAWAEALIAFQGGGAGGAADGEPAAPPDVVSRPPRSRSSWGRTCFRGRSGSPTAGLRATHAMM